MDIKSSIQREIGCTSLLQPKIQDMIYYANAEQLSQIHMFRITHSRKEIPQMGAGFIGA